MPFHDEAGERRLQCPVRGGYGILKISLALRVRGLNAQGLLNGLPLLADSNVEVRQASPRGHPRRARTLRPAKARRQKEQGSENQRGPAGDATLPRPHTASLALHAVSPAPPTPGRDPPMPRFRICSCPVTRPA